MAQFKAFADGVEVTGETVLAFIKALSVGQEMRALVLDKHGIKDPQVGEWYPQQNWLSGFEEIAQTVGSNTLFMIGKAIPEHAQFPPDIDTVEKALQILDVAYHMNHRGGEIGYYKLVSYDNRAHKAVMECKNPYPSDFDRGILTTLFRKFKTSEMFSEKIEIDGNKESRQYGGESCTFNITWEEIG